MRRIFFTLSLALTLIVCAIPAHAQEGGGKAGHEEQSEQSDPWLKWKWINFLLLVGGLGYLIGKNAPAFFRQRAEEIQRGIAEAAKEKKAAEERVAAVEKRLASLESEIKSLRANAQSEIAAEGQRIGHETENRLQRIQEQSAQEITLIARNAKAELRKFSAELALSLAEQRIRSRMTADVQNSLVDGFVHDLHASVTPEARN